MRHTVIVAIELNKNLYVLYTATWFPIILDECNIIKIQHIGCVALCDKSKPSQKAYCIWIPHTSCQCVSSNGQIRKEYIIPFHNKCAYSKVKISYEKKLNVNGPQKFISVGYLRGHISLGSLSSRLSGRYIIMSYHASSALPTLTEVR